MRKTYEALATDRLPRPVRFASACRWWCTAYRERLEERIAELFQTQDLDPDRLHQEVILLAERTDVAEELTRLEAHLQAMTGLLEAEGAIGRKIDFPLAGD